MRALPLLRQPVPLWLVSFRLVAAVLLGVGLAACSNEGRRPYVGTWQQADSPTAASMRYTFFADGRARIVDRTAGEARTYEARFTVEGDSILELSDGQEPERFQVRLDGDTLRIRSPETARTNTLVRVRAGG